MKSLVFFHMLPLAAAVQGLVATEDEGEMPKLLHVLRSAGTADADGFQIAPGAHAPRVKDAPRSGPLRRLQMNLFGGLQDALAGKVAGDGNYLPGRDTALPVKQKHYQLQNPMKGPWPEGYKVAVFANGCFWGSEKGAWRLPGVYSTAVGYAAGFTPNPTYEEACSGRTGSTEAVQVVYDPKKLSFSDLLRWFWQSHDPTQGNRQGNDRGTQYRSGFYYFDEEQKALIEASKAAYEKQLGQPITTEVRAAADFDQVFYYAEDYHQQYLAKPMARPYCSAQPREVDLAPFEQWAPEGYKSAAPKLPEKFWDENKPKRACSVVYAPNEQIVMDE